MPKRENIITKSKYMIGLKCKKYIWIVYNRPDIIPEITEETKQLFKYGHKVGELAKKLYPNGINIPTNNFENNINKTKDMLNFRKTLFEPGFLINNLYSRIDILNPIDINMWDLLEVKQSTKVKNEYIQDIVFQKYCLEMAGFNIRNCFLVYVNNKYVKHGNIVPNRFFKVENINTLLPDDFGIISKEIDKIFDVINLDKCPDVGIGSYCKNPYICPLIKKCWAYLPKYNILELYYGGKKSFSLLREGILDIKDAPKNRLTERQIIQRICAIKKKIYINKTNIRDFINNLQYPIYFMDFETIFECIPIYENTKPFQQIVFQYSVHMLKSNKSELEHFEFLAKDQQDPRQQFIKKLKNILGISGSIIVYNKIFEIKRLEELAELFPKYKNWVVKIKGRIIDLLKIFRDFSYYNPNQHGSCSLKKVLPAIVGRNYNDLIIQEGSNAGINWLLVTFNSDKLTKDQIKEIRNNLKLYCSRDTESMVWILNKLKNMVNIDL